MDYRFPPTLGLCAATKATRCFPVASKATSQSTGPGPAPTPLGRWALWVPLSMGEAPGAPQERVSPGQPGLGLLHPCLSAACLLILKVGPWAPSCQRDLQEEAPRGGSD